MATLNGRSRRKAIPITLRLRRCLPGHRIVRAATIAVLLFAGTTAPMAGSPALAQTAPTSGQQPDSVFAMPEYFVRESRAALSVMPLFRSGKYAEAERRLDEIIANSPDWPVHHYNMASALARQGRGDEAMESLRRAIELGFSNLPALDRDPDLDEIRGRDEFKTLVENLKANGASGGVTPFLTAEGPGEIVAGKAIVTASNTVFDPRTGSLISAFRFPSIPESGRVRTSTDGVARRLNLWYGGGEVAGNLGDLYDNRDDGHSRLSAEKFPQVTHIEYDAEARAAKAHYGITTPMLFNAITIGNSSTAVTGPSGRSQARLIQTNPQLMAQAFLRYSNNALYVFPEHRDHDPDRGDRFPANVPYVVVSQGSSGSDRPFVEALVSTLAAFRPRVKAQLRRQHLIAPTLQMILRSSLTTVESPSDYLSAAAHPSAFDSETLDVTRMILRARNLAVTDIPPVVLLSVVEESTPTAGVEYFGPGGPSERLFDTPNAIGRIYRSTAGERTMTVSVTRTRDPNDNELSFTWKVLRGDPDRVSVTPKNSKGTAAEIRVGWQERRNVPGRSDLTTDRVEIAVFAGNGRTYSAPSFVTFMFPPDQKRRYDADGRISEIDYAPAEFKDRYVDPLLFPRRPWRDTYQYDPNGNLLGWERTKRKRTRRYAWNGARVLDEDAQGRPMRAERVSYAIKAAKRGRGTVIESATGEIVEFRYDGPDDLKGTVVPQ